MKKYVSIFAFALMMSACTSATVTVKEEIVIEYGSEIKLEDLVNQEGLALKEIKEYDAKKVGEQIVTAVFDQAGKEITQEIKLEVKDTQKPEITLNKEEVEITVGDEYNPKSNVKVVKDPVDGDIKYSDAKDLKKDGYQITGEIKTDTAGTYELKVNAFDVNGNKNEKSFKVIVKEKLTDDESGPSGTTTNANTSGTSGTNVATGGGETMPTPTPAPQQPSPTPEPTPTPEPAPQPTPEPEPTVLCPNGTYPDKPCDYVIIGDGVPGNSGVWTESEEEAIKASHDFSGQWEGYSSYVVETEWNDGRVMWTVVYY